MGGRLLADDLADRLGSTKRILVLEAGSVIYPTHVYNLCRFSNASLARHFGCDTFWQGGNQTSQNYIGEKPQFNLGGRSIFWSGLIPTIKGWELEFFPPRVRSDLTSGLLNEAGDTSLTLARPSPSRLDNTFVLFTSSAGHKMNRTRLSFSVRPNRSPVVTMLDSVIGDGGQVRETALKA